MLIPARSSAFSSLYLKKESFNEGRRQKAEGRRVFL
jgi:hypothetical protein